MLWKKQDGFTLFEFIIYIALFGMVATFLVAVFSSITQIEVNETGTREITHQLDFASKTIQRLVQESSVVDIPSGTPTSMLTLRMSSSVRDPTLVYSSGAVLYLKEGTGTPIALTEVSVVVDSFTVTKFDNADGRSIVEAAIAVSYVSGEGKTQKTLRAAVARVNAASFDSDLLPNTSGILNLGNPGSRWKNGYFSGSVGVGVDPVLTARIKTNGDIAFSDPTAGLILISPGAFCYRLSVNDNGGITTTTAACP